MPKFIDHHTMAPMSPEKTKEMTQQIKTMINAKKADKFGVIMLNVFLAPGEAWGFTDAPNAEAVVKNHEAMGIKISVSDVKQVSPVV